MRFEIKNIEPMGAVRMTTRGKYVKDNAKRYLDYKKVIYYEILKQLDGVYNPLDAAIEVTAIFKMPIPSSWSKIQKANAGLHTKKPDIDNLLKGLFDSLNGLLWVDDNRISKVSVVKAYSNDPGIELEIEAIGGLSHGQEGAAKKETETKQRAARKAEARAGRDIRARI